MTDEPTHSELSRASRLLGALATVVELSLDSMMEHAALAACQDVAEFVNETVAHCLDDPDFVEAPAVAHAQTAERPAPITDISRAGATIDKNLPKSVSLVEKRGVEANEPATFLTGGTTASIPGAARALAPTHHDTRQKTPERVELLRELFVVGGPTLEEIRHRLNLLPGAEIPMSNLRSYIMQWGIATSAKDELRPAHPPTLRDIASREGKVVAPEPVVRPSLTTPAAAKQTIAGLAAAAASKPVLADAATIRSWAGQRGIQFDRDLGQVNAKRRQLQLPPFELEHPRHAG